MELKPVNNINNDANTIRVSDGNSPIRLIFKDVKGEVINLYDKIDYFYLTKDDEKFYSVTDISYDGDEVIIRLPKLKKGQYKAEIRDKDGSIYPANEDLYILLRRSFEDDKDIYYFGHREDILNSVEPIIIQHIDKNPNKFRGERGQQGFPGRDGLRGIDGKDGERGLPGKDGQDGKDGEKGDKGIDISNTEVIQARGNFSNLNNRITDSFRNVGESIGSPNVTYSKFNNKGTLVIMDDDTMKTSYNILYPFAKQHGIKITLSAISGKIKEDNTTHINIEEFREMRDNDLVEFVNHTHTHPRLADLNAEQIEYEISKCEEFLADNGVFTKHLVYPYGSVNDLVKQIASKYTNSASKSNGLNISPNVEVLDTFQLNRIVFEESESTFQSRINQAASSGGCVLINSHSQYETFDLPKLLRIVNMAKAAGLDIVHYSEAFKRFSNAIEIREEDGQLIGGVSSAGKAEGIFTGENINTVYTTTISTFTLEPGKWQSIGVDCPGVKVGDPVAFSYSPALPNEFVLTGPRVAIDGIARFRINNVSKETSYTVENFKIFLKKV